MIEKGLYYNQNNEIVFCGNKENCDTGNIPGTLIWVDGHEEEWPDPLIEYEVYAYSFIDDQIVPSLKCLIKKRCVEVDRMKRNKFSENMLYDGAFYQVDFESMALIQFRASYANASILDPAPGVPWSNLYKTWRDADNNDVIFNTAEDFITFSKAVSDHCSTIAQQCMTHKDALRAMESDGSTYQDVTNYDITTGW